MQCSTGHEDNICPNELLNCLNAHTADALFKYYPPIVEYGECNLLESMLFYSMLLPLVAFKCTVKSNGPSDHIFSVYGLTLDQILQV